MRETSHVLVPDVNYARSGDVAIAYQVIGDGPIDVMLVPDWMSNLVWAWHTPYWRNFYERLSSFARLIVFDKRGTGLSDRPRFFPDLETRIDDVLAVLDAVASERTALVAARKAAGWRRSSLRRIRSGCTASCSTTPGSAARTHVSKVHPSGT